MTETTLRPLVAGEEHLFETLDDPGLVGQAIKGRTYADGVTRGEYRPEWTWVALREDTVVARAAWFAGPDDTEPRVLDWFDFAPGDEDAAVALLSAAPWRTEYGLELPPGWRDDPRVRAAGERRMRAAEAIGMRQLVERYVYRWTPACGVPERPGRLEFRPDPDDEAFLDAFRRVDVGSLDAHTVRTAEAEGAEAAARDNLAFLTWLPSPRDWWLLAYTPDGDLVGLTVPGANHNHPIVGFVGVVPEQRGHGYGYDLLVECTHRLAAEGVTEIAASTDLPNLAMAAAFARAGYPVASHRIDLV